MKIICISGKARHGKDITATYMSNALEKRGYKVLIAHYGDLLKYVCRAFFKWDGEKNEAGRTLLQYVGTDVIRNQDENFWVDFIKDILKFFPDEWDCVLIPDCRFPNEIFRIKDTFKDTVHIRVVRPDCVSPLTEEQLDHISETALDDVAPDYLVYNCGELEDHERRVEVLTDELVAKMWGD